MIHSSEGNVGQYAQRRRWSNPRLVVQESRDESQNKAHLADIVLDTHDCGGCDQDLETTGINKLVLHSLSPRVNTLTQNLMAQLLAESSCS